MQQANDLKLWLIDEIDREIGDVHDINNKSRALSACAHRYHKRRIRGHVQLIMCCDHRVHLERIGRRHIY